ncbi:MAG TPA: hypothetical protein PK444_04195 [Syntrophorhabdaceae bacterium]|nr:hypothetical protein [Syntrophorhabdaceae bacterium]
MKIVEDGFYILMNIATYQNGLNDMTHSMRPFSKVSHNRTIMLTGMADRGL